MLATKYLGLDLPHPLMVGASPMVDDLDRVRRLEDAGAAAVVMHSLHEEQLTLEELATHDALDADHDPFVEAASYLPKPEAFPLGPGEYLDQIFRLKSAVDIPVIGSLNGTSMGGWLSYAQLMEQAGADALELNLYAVSTSLDESAERVEDRQAEVVRAVLDQVDIPVAVKLSPWYTSPPRFAKRLDDLGVAGLVVFNRCLQPDIDPEALEVDHRLQLSHSDELLPRLRWLALLRGRVRCSLAVTGGVHQAIDAVKALMVGADAVQLVSVLLRHGPEQLAAIRRDLERWLLDHDYDDLATLRGSMSLERCRAPAAYERAQYLKVLQSWRHHATGRIDG
ncbi:MAG: dihydroorotate dehydrogenase-like protein [Gemmatimonadetes bacterium]|nr:dihydroorotate dehydrogenase-like protein [Gemmatimonadota bacterium]